MTQSLGVDTACPEARRGHRGARGWETVLVQKGGSRFHSSELEPGITLGPS